MATYYYSLFGFVQFSCAYLFHFEGGLRTTNVKNMTLSLSNLYGNEQGFLHMYDPHD